MSCSNVRPSRLLRATISSRFVIELDALAGRYGDPLYSTAPPSKSHRGSVARIRDAWEDAKACEIPLESSPK